METQNKLLLNKLLEFYRNNDNSKTMVNIISGESNISLRLVDWFVTNYAKENYTIYDIQKNNNFERFKVYNNYKLMLKSYSKKRFDPFCRWDRISIPYNNIHIQTTIGQLNFFKWIIENNILDYIKENYNIIEKDMNTRNKSNNKNNSYSSTSSEMSSDSNTTSSDDYINYNTNLNKTRKKREELSINSLKNIKKENINTIIIFN
tara:strand:+ start:342 stop:956 length:615 start_codon:yes stop_codon:yes gene_type:complete